MREIDIATTATIRPGLLEETFKSFRSNLLSDNFSYRLILNIDPIGQPEHSQQDVLDIAKKWFSNIVVNMPDVPCFTQAVIWCWKQVKNEYVFHLEDDWILLKTLDLSKLVHVMDKHPEYSSFRLSKWRVHGGKTDLIECDKISLNPIFIRKSFVHTFAPLMMLNKNPEKQLRLKDPDLCSLIKNTRHAVYTECGFAPIVADIGREWMNKTKLFSKSTGFLNWKAL